MVQRWLLDCRFRIAAAVLAAGALVTGCAGSSAPIIDSASFVSSHGTPSLDKNYRINSGDKLKITVFGEENLSGQFDVGTRGQISMPLIGELQANGLSLNNLRDSIAQRLSDGYLKNPKVSVEIAGYRPVFVQGEVRNGGEFPYKVGLTLRDAIAMAGGYNYRADQSYLYIGRNGAPDVAVRTLNNIEILPGDNLRIPERFF